MSQDEARMKWLAVTGWITDAFKTFLYGRLENVSQFCGHYRLYTFKLYANIETAY